MSDMLGALIFGTIGLLLVYVALKEIRIALASRSWPTVEGTIISSEVETLERRKGSVYRASVRFEYEVDGRTHRCDGIGHGEMWSGIRGIASKKVGQYRPGDHVRVSFNPNDAGTALLEPDALTRQLVILGMGVMFLAFGALVLGMG